MAKEVSDIANRLSIELPQRITAILAEKNLDTRAKQAINLNEAIKKLQAAIDTCGEATVVSKRGEAIAALKTAANQILTAQAVTGNSNAPIPELSESLLAIGILLSEQLEKLSPLLPRPLPPVPSKPNYTFQALAEASKTNNLQEATRLSKFIPERSDDPRLALNIALENKSIAVACFWIDFISDFSHLTFEEFGCPNLSFKLCSDDRYQPVLEAYFQKYKKPGLANVVLRELQTAVKLTGLFLKQHHLEKAYGFRAQSSDSYYYYHSIFSKSSLNPCEFSLLTGQGIIVAYLKKILTEDEFAMAIPKPFMALIYNIDRLSPLKVTLKQLALAATLLKESKSTEMPGVLQSLAQKNEATFSLRHPAVASLQPVPRFKLLMQYALLYYVFARSKNFSNMRDYSEFSPFASNDEGIKNAFAFVEQVNQCVSETDFLKLLQSLLTKAHRSNDVHSFRGALLPLLCRFGNLFVEILKVDADRCQDGFPTCHVINFEKLEPFIECVTRLLQIHLTPEEKNAFLLKNFGEYSTLGNLRNSVNLATHQYFQNNCLTGSVSEPGFEKAKKFWASFIAIEDKKAAYSMIATTLTQGQATAYKENSHLYLIARNILQNELLCTKFKISNNTKALTDKNALVKAVAADICAAFSITPVTTSLVSSLGGLLRGRTQEKTGGAEMHSLQKQ